MSAPEPTFTRDGTTPLYWADPADRVTAFLATDPDALGAQPLLTTTWSTDPRGIYVFLATAPADSAAFLRSLQEWLDAYQPSPRPRFLWILNAGEGYLSWVATQLAVRRDGDGTYRLDGADFLLADYQLAAVGGGTVTPGASTGAGWGFEVGDTELSSALVLYTPADMLFARPGSSVLSMVPGSAGAWRFGLDARRDEGDGFVRLGAGMRFFTPGDGGFVNTLRFAVVRQPEGADLTLHAQIDPLRPLDGTRTSLGFFPWPDAATDAGDQPSEQPALPSGYVTALGYEVSLTPQPASPTHEVPARLVLAFSPYFVGESTSGGYYFVPDGSFQVSVSPPAGAARAAGADPVDRIVCGTSGMEYLGVPVGSGCALTFYPDHHAFAPLGTESTGADSLTGPGTTSWVSVSAPPDVTVRYYSQPEDAPLFKAPDASAAATLADDSIALLEFYEIAAADLAGPSVDAAAGAMVFPMAPFHGMAEGVVTEAVAIEQRALAPTRRDAVVPPTARERAADASAEHVGVTPQGLGVGVTDDGLAWTWLGIGHTGDAAALPDLRFTSVTGKFQQAMQTNNLFMVVGNPVEFARHGSVAYQLTALALNVIGTPPGSKGIPATVLDAVRARMTGTRYETRDAFLAALQAASPGITDEQSAVFERFASQLTPVIGGFPFRLAPGSSAGGYLLFKFALGRTVDELAGDVSTWSWPEAAASDGAAKAQKDIQDVITAAKDAVARSDSSPYANFVEVVTDPNWTGVLALSVDVPLEQLPAELQVLSAGINPEQFRAHHFGMSVTPYRLDKGAIRFQRTSMFGLIDYQNPEDQYFSENIPFAFRVLQLTVGVRNSVVTTFASRVQLLINRLFGAPARLFPTTHGNNIMLDGAHQQQQMPDGSIHDTYVFSMSGQNTFRLDGLVLQSVELLSTQLVTAKAADPVKGDPTVQANFQLAGNLRFYEPPNFDPFCWGATAAGEADGYLRFGNLGIAMSFSLGDPANPTFRLLDGNLSFDTANSKARADALVSKFPIRLAGLVATPDPVLSPGAPPQSPADLGYTSVTAPLDQAKLSQPWYGLDYTIELGTLGALSGNKAIAIGLLVAWSPGVTGTEPSVYLGVRLPGAKDVIGVSLPLQGVLKLGFKGIEMQVDNDVAKGRTYTLVMRDFALRLLGLAFPPGYNDVILFGVPNQTGDPKIGWYMAYASDSDKKSPTPAPTQQLVQQVRATRRPAGED